MIYSLDSADINTIKKGLEKFPIKAFSMNPSIAARDLKGSRKSFFESLQEIRKTIGEDAELYVQVVGESVGEMVEDAKIIRKNVSGNLLIKIPACENGFKAIQLLKEEGYKVACTAVMTLNQALLAAAAGADIIAVYISRINKNGGDGIKLLEDITKAYKLLNCNVMISAASIKDPNTVERAALAGAQCVAVSYELLEACATHPLTPITLAGFRRDWEDTYGKNKRLSEL
ncbi:transaldolase family protein [Tepidanaerobacter syntrophicus]|uniref:Fructose-6-phosphate aldolase 2 n=1 Tax=Tepidanaerobacter syntrophicus TaxID=224999 RepID=A0A0U9HG85_9FIRM|nr:transaldolase family protein [Tepidanaerobacter syntrophicus]GAQ24900.1 fructose-6-phosphate aldolase 2 [Tepidanaerobacter syntrophicus]